MSKSDNVDNIIEEIQELQNDITQAEQEIANINGRIDNVLETTQSEFNASSLKELTDFIESKENEIEKLDEKIKKKYEVLQKKKQELTEEEELDEYED
jgi:flagellar biosynthesis chaperone FliJ